MSKYILVDAVSSFRMRYAVAVPDDLPDDKAKEWAMDSVTCEEVQEFSQEHIGEQISATRILSEDELIKQRLEDEPYLSAWSESKLLDCVLVLDDEGNITSGKANWN